jgi:predicted small secreted protein
MKTRRFTFALSLALSSLGAACSETGTVEGVGLSDCRSAGDSVALSVKLADGRQVKAGRGKNTQGGRITGGQRVKLKKVKAAPSGEECWEVVQWLD